MIYWSKRLTDLKITYINVIIFIQSFSDFIQETQDVGEIRTVFHEGILTLTEHWVLSRELTDVDQD